MTNKNNLIVQTSFHHSQTSMASSGLGKNVILTKIIFTTDGIMVCAKGYTWCQRGVGTPSEGPYLQEVLVQSKLYGPLHTCDLILKGLW